MAIGAQRLTHDPPSARSEVYRASALAALGRVNAPVMLRITRCLFLASAASYDSGSGQLD